MNTLFPIYIKLDQISTLLVGAGPVGLEKLQALLSNSPEAQVTVIAEEVSDLFREFILGKSNVKLIERSFDENDLNDKQLLILASNNPVFNLHVRELASQRNILLNVADKPALCDFYLGSVVQKGNLKIGISTNGKSPTIAKRIKEFLQELLPDELDQTLNLMSELRDHLKGDFKHKVNELNKHTASLLIQYEQD